MDRMLPRLELQTQWAGTYHLLPATYHYLPATIYFLVLITYSYFYLLLATHYLSPTTYYLLNNNEQISYVIDYQWLMVHGSWPTSGNARAHHFPR